MDEKFAAGQTVTAEGGKTHRRLLSNVMANETASNRLLVFRSVCSKQLIGEVAGYLADERW